MKDNFGKFKGPMARDLASGVKMIEGDDQVREQKCLAAINQVLAQFDCQMIPEVIISGPKMVTRVAIIAQKRGSNNGLGNLQN